MTALALVACVFAHALTAAVSEDVTLASYMLVDGAAPGGVDLLPLKENLADVEIAGVVAHVRLTQRYQNNGRVPLHATYVFPGSTRAAVHAMRMTVGDKVITALLKERAAAQQDYQRAKERGQTASLLSQERPNVFTMRVTNILPQDVVTVELEYSELVKPTDGAYQFVLPGVVGPRYQGDDDDAAPRVSNPPLLSQATHRHDIAVHLLAPVPVMDVRSPSHAIGVQDGDGVTHVVLDGSEHNPGNRDFVLHYRLTGKTIQTGVVVHQGSPHNTLLAIIQPPQRVTAQDIRPREYIFVVDVSGSMHGAPLATAAALLEKLVAGLGPQDRFNVVLFESVPYVLSPQSLRATRENVRAAVQAMNAQRSGGGTQLLDGLNAALKLPRTTGVSRTVAIITDGYVNVEARAMRLIQDHLEDMNVFAFGIGQAVNRHLIEGLARAGRGEPFVVLTGSGASGAAERFWEYIRAPVMTDVKVRFEGLDVQDVSPVHQPDVFASRPLEILAHFSGSPRGEVVVTGTTGAGPVELRASLVPTCGTNHPVLPLLWARQRITDLTDAPPDGEDALKKAVLPIALEHGLLSAFTSFVAVDERVRGNGDALTVEQPSPLPQGLSNVFGVGGLGTGSAGMLNGLSGSSMGYGSGIGGLGTRGSGAGGGGLGQGGRSKGTTSIHAGKVVVMGSISKDAIQRVIRSRLASLKYCYERELLKSPTLAGRLVVQFTLDASGKVTHVGVVEDTLKAPAVAACVEKQFKSFRFPAVPGGGTVTVNYPLVFKAPN